MTAPDFVDDVDLAEYQASDPQTIIAQAQATVRSYCGWHVAPSLTETILLDGKGSRHLWLPSLHVTDVDLITNEGVEVAADEYDWSADGYVELVYAAWWSLRPRQVEVTFTHGFDDIPADLIGVAAAIATRRSSSPSGIRREQAGALSLDYGTSDLLADEKATLDRYKLPPRP